MLNEYIHSSVAEAWDSRAIKGLWENSPFEDLVKLSSDERGRWGEQLLHRLLTNAGITSQWEGDSNINPGDGTYDLYVSNKHRVEVKTAIYSSKTWQHDGLRTNGSWDYTLCIDLSFNAITISVISYDEFAKAASTKQKHTVFNVTPHLRKNTTDVWKFDLRVPQHRLGTTAGCTFEYAMNEPNEEGLYNFLRRIFE